MNNKKQAFTLVEMMIVLIILSYFLLTTIPNLNNILDVASSKTCEAQINLINSAILQYHLEYSSYPNHLEQLISHGSIEESHLKCNGKWVRYENNKAKAP